MTWTRSISVVVPVYNSEGTLEELVERVSTVLGGLAVEFEIILVNDASADGSWEVIDRLVRQNPRVVGIDLMRNFGQHNALLAGIRRAVHRVIVTVDDDLQHPPEEIPLLLARLDQGVDVVYGTPRQDRHSMPRNLASKLTKLFLAQAMSADVARQVSAFRAFDTRLRDAFGRFSGPWVSIDVLLSWGTTRFSSVEVEHHPRKAGTSNYSTRKLVRHALNMMTGLSVRPLQLASLMGFIFTAFGVLLLGYVLITWVVLKNSVHGFAFLASTIAIFSGVQLFALGVIGEYLARVHVRTMDKPSYAIRSTSDGRDRLDGASEDSASHEMKEL